VGSEGQLRFSLAAEPESIGLARRAVGDLARGLGLEEPALGDLKTIVSEACSNVVRHAYPEEEGSFDLETAVGAGLLTIVVRDFGRGIQPRAEVEPSSLRLGLGLISSLTSHFEISGNHGGGTEVRMQVPLSP
jgi:anti-sigma regulatory factor (Ser/Thr protein kinase)